MLYYRLCYCSTARLSRPAVGVAAGNGVSLTPQVPVRISEDSKCGPQHYNAYVLLAITSFSSKRVWPFLSFTLPQHVGGFTGTLLSGLMRNRCAYPRYPFLGKRYRHAPIT